MTAALEVRHVSKRFGQLTAVDDVTFTVGAGEIVGFIGPNGAGKTTTMRICATLELPDQGDAFVAGASVMEEPRAARRRLGFMPDAYGTYANTTVHDYLDFFARAYGLKGASRRDTIARVMSFTSLGPLAEREMSVLSKGMRQRLCLAKTLLHDPLVMILDEPASGLDPRARVELRELVKALAEMGKAILISSHILTELSEMCDGIVVIEQGRVRATGAVEDIVRRLSPTTPVFLRTLADPDLVERLLLEQPHVSAVRREHHGLAFTFAGSDEDLAQLVHVLVQRGARPVAFAPVETNLEDVFLKLTQGKVQ